MRLLKYFFLAFTVSFFSCEESPEDNFCEVDSIYDLEWLREEMESKGYFQFTSIDVLVYNANYLNREVIYIEICCHYCDVVPPEVRSCNGSSLGRIGGDIDSNLITNKEVIWRTNNGICP
jgi:hypothetical protein